MTLTLWCVLIAALLPFPFAAAAKWSSRFNNVEPRTYLNNTSGWRQRAHWVQLNSFEAFPAFAAAAIIAHVVVGPNGYTDLLAMAFVALRIAFGLCYLANLATLRSLVWMASQACIIGLFVIAARATHV